jgi:hypothetical protein
MLWPTQCNVGTRAGLSREGRLRLLAGIVGLLRDHGDALRSDASRRVPPGPRSGSPYFRFDYIFQGGGRFWRAAVLLPTWPPSTGCVSWCTLTANPGLECSVVAETVKNEAHGPQPVGFCVLSSVRCSLSSVSYVNG